MQKATVNYLGLSGDATVAHQSGTIKQDDLYNQQLSNYLFSKLEQIGKAE